MTKWLCLQNLTLTLSFIRNIQPWHEIRESCGWETGSKEPLEEGHNSYKICLI